MIYFSYFTSDLTTLKGRGHRSGRQDPDAKVTVVESANLLASVGLFVLL